MISAQPVTNYPEQSLLNTYKASIELISERKIALKSFLSSYAIASQVPMGFNGRAVSNTALYSETVLRISESTTKLFDTLDAVSVANKLFAHTKPLTGDFMELLDITFQNSISKTPFEI
jgi:hypothetical protein